MDTVSFISRPADEPLVFVIRLWREPGAGDQDAWYGRVEHVASQQITYIQGSGTDQVLDHVLCFIEHWIKPGTPRA